MQGSSNQTGVVEVGENRNVFRKKSKKEIRTELVGIIQKGMAAAKEVEEQAQGTRGEIEVTKETENGTFIIERAANRTFLRKEPAQIYPMTSLDHVHTENETVQTDKRYPERRRLVIRRGLTFTLMSSIYWKIICWRLRK